MSRHCPPLPPSPPLSPSDSRYLSRARPRGDDGRFVPRAEEHHPADARDRKVCGWCRRTQTSQWRVGPTTGSLEMGTLCNACGINYRRALQKAPDTMLDLDQLAQQQGTRLSIQKALKRQRKLSPTLSPALSPALTQFKPNRTAERRHSSLNMLLSSDTSSPTWHAPPAPVSVPHSNSAPLPPPPPPPLPSMHSYGRARTSPALPLPSSALSPRHAHGWASSSRHRRADRLPPFQDFIGRLPSRE
ncbi:unnamed protein product [Agarophyton chilense]